MKQGWEVKKLGEVCTILMGQSPSSDTYNDLGEGLPFFQGNADFGRIHPSVRVYCNAPIRIADVDDILISVRAPIGAINITNTKCCIGRGLAAIKNGNRIKKSFAYHALIANKDKLIALGTGSTFKSIGRTALNDLLIPVPPLDEQENIVAELDCLSGIIEKKKQQLKEYDALAQSIFYEMFGNPIDNEKGWDIFTLSKNVKVKGRVGWKGYKKEDLRDSGPLAIGGGHLTDSGGIDLSSPVFLSMEKYLESPEIMIEVGDIILVQRGTIGKVGLIANDIGMATINPCVLILRPENLNSVYLLHYFLNSSIQAHLKALIKGVAQPMITQQQVNGLLLPIPPLYLQQEFASKIETIEKQKELIKQSIAETETLFNSRIDFYFN